MRWTRNDVSEGMSVTSTTGERLGKVIRTGADTFVIEKGVFFPKDYELRYDHITALGGDQITYTLSDVDSRFRTTAETTRPISAAATARAANVTAERPSASSVAAARPAAAATASTTSRTEGDVRIPLREEELGIQKIARETGHVRIHKTVKTEEKHFSVPVSREDVVIERVAATGDEAGLSAEGAFEERTLDLPLHEEEVQVTKRTRIREHVVVHPVVHAVEKEASASLRHEEAEIEDTRGRVSSGGADRGSSEDDNSDPGGGYGAPGSTRR
ncbi:MAG TPA: YsnF/AvaK domain-containing protein [Polyangia bacterium]|nr:YsnF/AvaK domain-containing protein [Polyangia bacterium]